jgi:hypothetical protein
LQNGEKDKSLENYYVVEQTQVIQNTEGSNEAIPCILEPQVDVVGRFSRSERKGG